jgi:beta-glucosidase
MGQLGLNAYRFSVAWGRILPEGTGAVNQAGLDFYARLVDTLLQAGITPSVTLYHWDLPVALDNRGGWLNRDVADWFAEYAAVMFRALGDRVPMWTTLNEPWVVADGGYLHGKLAPGHRNVYEAPIASHNLMRAHAQAVRAYRAEARQRIGIVVNLEPKSPASHAPEDRAAASRSHSYMNEQYLDVALRGTYPAELRGIFGDAWQPIFDEEARGLREPIDFVGINYYTRGVMRYDPDASPVFASHERQAQSTHTETGWEVFPKGLGQILRWFKTRYGEVPLYITENGAAFYDPPVPVDGAVPDPLRVAYLRDHLRELHAAIADGMDVRGYFAWSLLDNFEWSLGFARRFGIVHVNYATQERTPKASAAYYSNIIKSNGEALG